MVSSGIGFKVQGGFLAPAYLLVNMRTLEGGLCIGIVTRIHQPVRGARFWVLRPNATT